MAIKAVHQGVQDYLVKGDITNKQLGRALSYAVERQGLLRALEITRKQQLEFKNQFLSHVSHELRTPLTCIHQYVPILLDGLAGAMKPEQTDHLKTILKSVNQLHAMIRDLLEAARADSGKLRIEPRCIDIGELMQQAVAMMRPTAAEKHVGLQAALDQAVPLVYADPDRTIEVLINLIDNAIKFTPANGSVAVLASMVETDPAVVYISVSDTGRGARKSRFRRFSNVSIRIRTRWMIAGPVSVWGSSSPKKSLLSTAGGCGLQANPARAARSLSPCRSIPWLSCCSQ